MELDILDKKVAYFEGRPSGHPIHSEYAKIINSHFNYIDKYLRYHDKPSSPIIRYLSYLLTALFFPINDFDVVFTEEGYFQLGLMRLFGRLKNKKLIGLMATHTAYFIKKKKYSKLTCKAFIETYKQYDSFICIGDIQYNLMSELLENTNVRIYKIFNGLKLNQIEYLNKLKLKLDSKRILFIGNLDNSNRLYSKGFDIVLNAFEDLIKIDRSYQLLVVGSYNDTIIDDIVSDEIKDNITFVGLQENISPYILQSSLYVHPGRGDAFPTTILEMSHAGLPIICSNEIGNYNIVSKVKSNMVINSSSVELLREIVNYFQLSIEHREQISAKLKISALPYNEERAKEVFMSTMNKIINEKLKAYK